MLLSVKTAERLKSLAARLDVLADAKEIIEIVSSPFEEVPSDSQISRFNPPHT
jgi:hypothetical protein